MAILVTSIALVIGSRRNSTANHSSYLVSLAHESALEDALGKLIKSTTREHFTVYKVDQYYITSWFDEEKKRWVHQPLAGGLSEELSMVNENAPFTPFSKELEAGKNPIKIIIKDETVTVPRINLGNGISYSYWIEDLNKNLEYEVLTHEGDWYGPHLTQDEKKRMNQDKIYEQRHLGINVFSSGENGRREVPSDFSDPFAPRNDIPFPLTAIMEKNWDEYLIDQGILRTELPDEYGELYNYINTGLADTIAHDIVPYGFGYPNAGELKLNLNEMVDLAPDLAVEQISSQLQHILGFQDSPEAYALRGISVDPEYPSESRYGGFPANHESYTRTIAANIIDYADIDSKPTLNRIGENKYRGLDAYPHYTEASRRYYLSDATEQGVVLQIRNFLELYNPTSQTVSGYLKFKFTPSPNHLIKTGGNEFPLPIEDLYYWDGVITIPPNGYRVLEVTQDLDGDFIGDKEAYLHYELGSTGAPSVTASRQSSKGNLIEIFWRPEQDGKPTSANDFFLIDGTVYGGLDVAHTSLIDTSNKNANNTLHGIPLFPGMTGDTRNTFYCSKQVSALNYATRSSFGGPNDYQLDTAGIVSPEALFPDRCYSPLQYGTDVRGSASSPSRGMRYPGEFGYVRWDNPEGVQSKNLEEASGNSISQFYVSPSDDNYLRHLQPISNKNYFSSLGELGNIYDPAQWKRARRPTRGGVIDNNYESNDYALNDEGELMKASELSEFGGGITLAIGSPEFHCFNRQGYESSRLLDQFRITESPVRSLKGKINLNTAPRPVLQALFSGFLHQDDQIIGEFTEQARNSSDDIASSLADGIIFARAERPFLSLSDIALAKAPLDGELLPLFGEKTFYQSHNAAVHTDLWNDQGREELFRKMNDLFTTQSRSYRIHLQIEVERHGITSSIGKEVEVTLHPTLDSNKMIDRSTPSRIKIHRLIKK